MLRLKQIISWLTLSVVTTGLIIGCGLSPGAQLEENLSVDVPHDCRIIKHDAGETKICGKPEKVAVLTVHSLDLLLSLDVQPAAYANTLSPHRGEIFDNPAQQIPYLGDRITTQPINLGSAGEPSLEKLAILKPDLIVGEMVNADSYGLLSQIAPTLLWQNRMDKGRWQENLRTIAAALGLDEKVEAVIQQHDNYIASTRADLVSVIVDHPRLLLLAAHRLDEGINVINADSYLGELLSNVGFQLMPQAAANPNAPISIETLLTLDAADTIIILGWDFDVGDLFLGSSASSVDTSVENLLEMHQVKTIKQGWEESAIAQSLTASQENRVYFATFYKWNGLNGPIGAELIVEQLRQFFLIDNRS